ncbi:hypothetical protein HPB47_005640 [Ixodes persulcatus]|uniref:Uncharacterized protein n=1 Tax=Ixodes persulcatus TaxID=34615 RepID=A0AC60PCD9_IXOPE|nr:hypothetical protein HPB47_005640 [Ixodes persulcatus]
MLDAMLPHEPAHEWSDDAQEVAQRAEEVRQLARLRIRDQQRVDAGRYKLGTFLVTQGASRAMIAGNVTDCAIVNMASMVAKEICPNMSVYSAAKAGVVALTRAAATELAVHGIRVNVVLPEVVDTPMVAQEFSAEEIARFAANHPLGRLCRPEEVAETVKFLCGPGSSCTSGVAVDVTYCFYKNSGRK